MLRVRQQDLANPFWLKPPNKEKRLRRPVGVGRWGSVTVVQLPDCFQARFEWKVATASKAAC